MVLLSVIVPVYNGANYIETLWKDLKYQDCQDCEYIFVDDGSEDGTWDILSDIKDPRVKIIKGNHEGPSSARNKGIDISCGEYIRFIDADDMISYNSNRMLLTPFFENQEIDLVIGNFDVQGSYDNYYCGDDFSSHVVSREIFLKAFLTNIYSFYYGVVWNKLYKKSIIEKNNIRFDETKVWMEDFDFNVNYYRYCRNVFYLNIKGGIYTYICRGVGITSSDSANLSKEEMINLREEQIRLTKKAFSEIGVETEIEDAMHFYFLEHELKDITLETGYSWNAFYKKYNMIVTDRASKYMRDKSIVTSPFFYYVWGVARLIKQKYNFDIFHMNWRGKK